MRWNTCSRMRVTARSPAILKRIYRTATAAPWTTATMARRLAAGAHHAGGGRAVDDDADALRIEQAHRAADGEAEDAPAEQPPLRPRQREETSQGGCLCLLRGGLVAQGG